MVEGATAPGGWMRDTRCSDNEQLGEKDKLLAISIFVS